MMVATVVLMGVRLRGVGMVPAYTETRPRSAGTRSFSTTKIQRHVVIEQDPDDED